MKYIVLIHYSLIIRKRTQFITYSNAKLYQYTKEHNFQLPSSLDVTGFIHLKIPTFKIPMIYVIPASAIVIILVVLVLICMCRKKKTPTHVEGICASNQQIIYYEVLHALFTLINSFYRHATFTSFIY